MRTLFIFLFCFMMHGIFADTIGNVEYHLPKEALSWKSHEMKADNGTTIIYFPNNDTQMQEFFGVHSSKRPSDINDLSSVEAGLTKMFPNMEVEFHVLNKTQNSALYKWSIKEDDCVKVIGLGRAFSLESGTVVFTYQTEKMVNITNRCHTWLSVLKKAKVK